MFTFRNFVAHSSLIYSWIIALHFADVHCILLSQNFRSHCYVLFRVWLILALIKYAPRTKRNRSYSHRKSTLSMSRTSPFATSLLIPLLIKSILGLLLYTSQMFTIFCLRKIFVHIATCYFEFGSFHSPSLYAKSAKKILIAEDKIFHLGRVFSLYLNGNFFRYS